MKTLSDIPAREYYLHLHFIHQVATIAKLGLREIFLDGYFLSTGWPRKKSAFAYCSQKLCKRYKEIDFLAIPIVLLLLTCSIGQLRSSPV